MNSERIIRKTGSFRDGPWPELHLVGVLNGDHWLDYKVYEACACSVDGPVEFCVDGDTSSEGFSSDYDKCDPLFAGFIKWDGCMQGCFQDGSACGVHFDDKDSAVKTMTALFSLIYDTAKEVIPAWSE